MRVHIGDIVWRSDKNATAGSPAIEQSLHYVSQLKLELSF